MARGLTFNLDTQPTVSCAQTPLEFIAVIHYPRNIKFTHLSDMYAYFYKFCTVIELHMPGLNDFVDIITNGTSKLLFGVVELVGGWENITLKGEQNASSISYWGYLFFPFRGIYLANATFVGGSSQASPSKDPRHHPPQYSCANRSRANMSCSQNLAKS